MGIFPINTETGALALATQYAVLGLRNGIEVPGAVVAVTESEIRIFKAPAAKGVHKGLAEGGNVCLAAGMVELAEYGVALVCAMKAGVLRVYSIPALKEVTDISVVEAFDKEQ